MSLFAKRYPTGRWSFLGPGSEKNWYSTYIDRPRGNWDRVAELMMIKFGESGHTVFRATSPFSRGLLKSKGGGQFSIHFCADGDTIETVFRTIISVNQLSIYGAVSDVCEEYGTCQTSTVRLVVAEQSDPLFAPANFLRMTPRPSINFLVQESQLKVWVSLSGCGSLSTRSLYFCNKFSCTRKFISKVHGTRGKASTTRSIDKDLY